MRFLDSYQGLCDKFRREPVTVVISLTTVPSPGILRLLEELDVVVPTKITKRLVASPDMGRESVEVAKWVLHEILAGVDDAGLSVPPGLQLDQVGINSAGLSVQLLDKVHSMFGV